MGRKHRPATGAAEVEVKRRIRRSQGFTTVETAARHDIMKINAKVVGSGPDPERTQALVNVIVEFSGPTQSMTLTVIVPNEGNEAALEEQGIAKAKDLALQFAADRQ